MLTPDVPGRAGTVHTHSLRLSYSRHGGREPGGVDGLPMRVHITGAARMPIPIRTLCLMKLGLPWAAGLT